jgi:hypothetical protein
MFFGYAIDTLRDGVPLPRQKAVGIFDMPHLLLLFRQSSLRGTATMLVNSMGHARYPATRTAATVCGSYIRKMRHYGEPHPFAQNGEQ